MLTHLSVDRGSEIEGVVRFELLERHGGKELAEDKPAIQQLEPLSRADLRRHHDLQTIGIDEETSELSGRNLGEVQRHGGLQHTNTHARKELCHKPMLPVRCE